MADRPLKFVCLNIVIDKYKVTTIPTTDLQGLGLQSVDDSKMSKSGDEAASGTDKNADDCSDKGMSCIDCSGSINLFCQLLLSLQGHTICSVVVVSFELLLMVSWFDG